MRKCNNCGSEMLLGFEARPDGAGYPLRIYRYSDGITMKSIGKPKAAVCPKCGEVSIYLEDLTRITEESR